MSQQNSVLYDVPGPRQRRITLVSSLIATVVVLIGAYLLIYRPLADKGQFSMELWGPLIDPSNENFTQVWDRLGVGLKHTLTAAALAILSSLVVGTLLAVLRIQLKSLTRRRFTGLATPLAYLLRGLSVLLSAVTRVCVEVFRGLPVVITIFFVARGFPEFGVSFDNLWYLVIGLTVYNSVVIAEILRSGMEGLPGGQAEAAAAIGLSPAQTTRMILLPQAFRIMLPALISQLVVVLKDTSLGFIISYEETLNIGKQIIGVLGNPIQVYAVIAVLFIAVNYSLSKLAQFVQHRLSRGRKTAGTPAQQAPATALISQAEGAGGN
ncbi:MULTISPECIES: amino acid ABC transporter permease [Micromonospora]|uniref:Amino acid ABC transporter permease n=1 Tax=Micromonospora solifontis TaxID=2487138 RepID=A0ABX9WN09_9ACTN|nr:MULTISPECIES: amino acid ABC transporter permease [Micromonospora]NES12839.1 amino acid ABC transporter permease [Micromonospora sp. PPF5-17B]NES34843.1 amino acid ABC transporter permease [Micromonospora solifontis]NES54764.1 amino acid ABC transporter permease [Micromonospora sp. PPF5-6]RNM01735.1 amino acid ABC transporter permease [Micromonospora solifontis]